jgi:hypothetical protein
MIDMMEAHEFIKAIIPKADVVQSDLESAIEKQL